MTLEEWKYYRNTTVKIMETLNEKTLAKILGIEMILAKDIQKGDFNLQTKACKRIINSKSKAKRHNFLCFLPSFLLIKHNISLSILPGLSLSPSISHSISISLPIKPINPINPNIKDIK